MTLLEGLLILATFGAATATPISVHDSPNQLWTNLSSIPRLRQEHTTVVVDNNTIAVVGGVTPLGNVTQFTGVRTVDWLHLYDIPSDSWRTAAPSPYKVNHPNVAAKNGLIYLLGGLIDASDPPKPLPEWIASGESHVYDPEADKWTKLESMPPGTERGSAVMGVYDELIYLAGGMTVLDGPYQDAVTTVTAFNTTSGKWQRLVDAAANIPEGRQHAAGAIVDDTFYVVGGRWFDKSNVKDEVFMLDLKNQGAGWATSGRHMPTARGGIAGAVVGRKMYTFGGEANLDAVTGLFDNVEVMDLDTQEWVELKPMSVPRHGTSAVAVGNKIYIPGGGLQQDGLTVVVNGVKNFINTTNHFDVLNV
ncbi:hypothetical protein NM208_g5400 [Fusarium decemcellulare]|uniref:Uncharacterized protein n=1 Tax=Fusarium decemcellulare TaxID=57161 RepID=A0ACC1SHG3_9HYPO|nr:hypothetical protein NM208_g5400 [Fusarium decemcellulare]